MVSFMCNPVGKFIDPDWGDKVNSGIGLSATWAGGPVRQPYAGVDLIPQSWIYEFSYWFQTLTIYLSISQILFGE
jgi:hypothetical protein